MPTTAAVKSETTRARRTTMDALRGTGFLSGAGFAIFAGRGLQVLTDTARFRRRLRGATAAQGQRARMM